MSAPGASGPYPNPKLDPNRKAKHGSFNDVANTNGRTPNDDRKAQTAEPRRSSNGGAACPGAENPNGSDSGKFKRKPADSELDWLPPGWTFEDRVRTSGVTAGSTDRYYFDPVSRRKFRSKREVLYFLETGTPRKKKKQGENSEADTPSVDSSGGQKQKPSTSEKGSVLNFNFANVPEKVQWVLTDSSEDSWKAFIGNEQVPESSKRDWLAAFTFLASKDRGRYH